MGADKFVGDGQRVDESGAHGLDIKGRASMNVQTLLQQTGGAGKNLIGRGCGDNDQVNGVLRDARRLHGAQGRLFTHGTAGLTVGGDVAFTDAGALDDPAIRGIHHFFQIGVGQNLLRQITAGADNARVIHACSLFSNMDPTSRPIRCGTCFSTSVTASKMACSNARTSALP